MTVMAMTKKERASLNEALKRASTLAALRWTTKVEPDVMPPKNETPGSVLAKGFVPNPYSMSIQPACSSSAYHSIGRQDKITSQRPIKMFSSRLLALYAMRNMVEEEAANRLAKIDDMIEQETQKED